MYIRQAIHSDYQKILALQAQNVPENLTPQQQQQGFIVSVMDERQLERINHALGILISVDEDQLAGFACLMTVDTQPRPPVVEAMLKVLATESFQGRPLKEQRVFLYGPVCVSAAWRGKGVLRQLFSAVKQRTENDFDVGALFINQSNQHSWDSHVKGLGMTALRNFSCGDESYQLIVFSTRS